METDAFDPVRRNAGAASPVVDGEPFHDGADNRQLGTRTLRPRDGAVHRFDSAVSDQYCGGLEVRVTDGVILDGDASHCESRPGDEPGER